MKLIYGNPSYNSLEMIKNSILVQQWNAAGIFDVLKEMPYPDEATTIKELWYLVDLSQKVDDVRMQHIIRAEKDLFGLMSELLDSHGIKQSPDEVYAKIKIYDPIIDYLKFVYNRPRPFQTAGYYGIPLFPRLQTDASDSSYPSGHTLLSLFFFHVYGKLYPELKLELLKFVLDIKKTREEGGVHYPSDGKFSFTVYNTIKKYLDSPLTF